MLGVATVATALVAEVLVGSLEVFADKAGLTDFFVAAVIVAIVGNAAEHGGAVLVAYRGKIQLAVEIALSSAAQVAVFLIPAVALLSLLIDPLALSFRQVEIAMLAASLVAHRRGALRRPLEPAARRDSDRRVRRCRSRLLPGGRALLEGRGLAAHRVRREVELLDPAVGVAHDPQDLAALAALGDAPAVVTVRLEVRDVPARSAVDQQRLQPALAPGDDDLVPLRPPAAEDRLELGRRLLARLPRLGRDRQRLDRCDREVERELLRPAPAPVFVSTAAPIFVFRLTTRPAR